METLKILRTLEIMLTLLIDIILLPIRILGCLFGGMLIGGAVGHHRAKKDWEDSQEAWKEVDKQWYGE